MREELITKARRAIDLVAERNGVTADQVCIAIQEAIQSAQKNATPKAELLWHTMTPDGSLPSPEQLIAWVANTFGH